MESINFDKVAVTSLDKENSEFSGLITIDGDKLVIETGPIKLTSYGIPSLNHYHPTDNDRKVLKMPLDNEQIQLKNFLGRADSFFGSSQFKVKLFGKEADQHEYYPLVRKPDLAEHFGITADRTKPIPDYCKIHFATNINGDISTIVKEKGVDINAKTISDVEKLVQWLSTSIYKICFKKIWTSEYSGKKRYGITLEMLEIDVLHKIQRTPLNIQDIVFVDE